MFSEQRHLLSTAEGVTVERWPWSLEKAGDLDQPYVTAGNRVYCIANQHGEFPEIGWRQPGEMAGVWDHPIKLLDGFWFGLSSGLPGVTGAPDDITWLTSARRWRMTPGEVEISYSLPQIQVIRREYGLQDIEGMLVCLTLSNTSQEILNFTLHFLACTDLRAAWLGENRLAWRDGRDEAVYLPEHACIAASNTVNPASVCFGATRSPLVVAIGNELWATKPPKGGGISAHLRYGLSLAASVSEEITFLIAGSTHGSELALATFERLRASPGEHCRQQRQSYQHVLERCALFSDDSLIDTAFGWAKTNLHMLDRDVPGIGHGISGGLPDFPWWFGNDTAYSTLALVASGQFELALTSLRTLAHYSKMMNSNGSVVHEILTQGHVHDTGHLVETPLFTRAVYHAFRWTGDHAFLRELYPFCKRGLLNYVLDTCDPDNDLCAAGKGLVETRELHGGASFETLDIAAYTYEALLCLAELAAETGDSAIIPELRAKAATLRTHVNSTWWLEDEGLFGDIYTSAAALAASNNALRAENLFLPGDVIEYDATDILLQRQARRARTTGETPEQERPWLLKHFIAAIPMETGLATASHARRALARLESSEFTNRWGIYLNPDRQQVTLTLPTSIMAVAEAQYSHVDTALAYSHKIARTLFYNMPGALSEIAPDRGCFILASASYGIIWPVVHHFFGFRPHAAARKVAFLPHLPASWRQARLQEVRVGSASMNLAVIQDESEAHIILETSDPLYECKIGGLFSRQARPRVVTLNAETVPFELLSLDEDNSVSKGYQVQLAPVSGLHRYDVVVYW
ncbi:MAG TPA: hypothetical protein VKV40_10280 [Ktedonobacteraceae bacterium]|nr:hypothetical protein [Ktedonobacteraceae bacterium]